MYDAAETSPRDDTAREGPHLIQQAPRDPQGAVWNVVENAVMASPAARG
jgi:hypothetical protein